MGGFGCLATCCAGVTVGVEEPSGLGRGSGMEARMMVQHRRRNDELRAAWDEHACHMREGSSLRDARDEHTTCRGDPQRRGKERAGWAAGAGRKMCASRVRAYGAVCRYAHLEG